MIALEGTYGKGNVPQGLLAGTIVPSFLKTFVHATGNALDVTNWKGNWDNYIKKSFEPRAQANK